MSSTAQCKIIFILDYTEWPLTFEGTIQSKQVRLLLDYLQNCLQVPRESGGQNEEICSITNNYRRKQQQQQLLEFDFKKITFLMLHFALFSSLRWSNVINSDDVFSSNAK